VTIALIESDRRIGKSLFGGSVPSLVLHAAAIGGAIFATLSAREAPASAGVDTTLVFIAPPAEREPPPPQPELGISLRGFQTVTVPEMIPAVIPPVNLQEHFDPKDFSGVGVEGGRADGIEPAPDHVFETSAVDEQPLLLAAPPPPYPELLRQAGIMGRVMLQAIVDTTGRVDPTSIKVLQSPNAGFEHPSRQWILKALFRPARVRGRAVRVLVHLPLDFSIDGRGG
jgi:protein TonB